MTRHIVCLTFDFDTQSGFIARGMTTPTPLSRGEFGGRVACNRILKFLAERNVKATWFTPGFTIESWPKECAAVVEGGHEIGHHSWAHIPPANQTREEEEADLVRANENIRKLTGKTVEKGLTLIPTKMYLKGGRIKCEIALAKGKKDAKK